MDKDLINWLASIGLMVLRNAVSIKGKEAVEEIIGQKFPTDFSNIDDKTKFAFKELEASFEDQLLQIHVDSAALALQNRQLDIEAQKVAVEDHKVDVAEMHEIVDDTKDARKMNVDLQNSHASRLVKEAPYYLDFIIIGATVFYGFFLFFFGIPTENKEVAYTVFGSMLTLTGTIINFHRGTSASSKNKDEFQAGLIKTLSGADKGGK